MDALPVLFGPCAATRLELGFALLTAAIETPVFWLCGYRRAFQCLCFAGVNVVTNLLLNEGLANQAGLGHYGEAVAAGEVLVLATEFALAGYFTSGSAWKRFLTVLAANLASFAAGIVLFW